MRKINKDKNDFSWSPMITLNLIVMTHGQHIFDCIEIRRRKENMFAEITQLTVIQTMILIIKLYNCFPWE